MGWRPLLPARASYRSTVWRVLTPSCGESRWAPDLARRLAGGEVDGSGVVVGWWHCHDAGGMQASGGAVREGVVLGVVVRGHRFTSLEAPLWSPSHAHPRIRFFG